MPGRPSPTGTLADVLGGDPRGRTVLGFFAHPDDEVFCAGGLLPLCADAGARTALVCLTRGEGGQIRQAAAATRRTLGSVRRAELEASARILGVGALTGPPVIPTTSRRAGCCWTRWTAAGDRSGCCTPPSPCRSS